MKHSKNNNLLVPFISVDSYNYDEYRTTQTYKKTKIANLHVVSSQKLTPNFGYWNNKKEKLRQLFPEISEEDLCFREGKEQIMIEMLEHKLGKSKEELRSIINEL